MTSFFPTHQGYQVCQCANNFAGPDCNQRLVPGQLSWSLLFELERLMALRGSYDLQRPPLGTELPHVRWGHSLLSLEPNQLWLFGGADPAGVDSDALYVYDLDFDRWKKVATVFALGNTLDRGVVCQ